MAVIIGCSAALWVATFLALVGLGIHNEIKEWRRR